MNKILDEFKLIILQSIYLKHSKVEMFLAKKQVLKT